MPNDIVEQVRGRLAAQGLVASSWSNAPGDRYGAHRHGYDKVLVCGLGSIDFELPERKETVRLSMGDRLDLPAGTLHGALVGADGVTCLEAHLAAGSLASEPVTTPGWAVKTDPLTAA